MFSSHLKCVLWSQSFCHESIRTARLPISVCFRATIAQLLCVPPPINPSHMSIHMEPSYYPPAPLWGPASGLWPWYFSWSLSAVAQVAQRLFFWVLIAVLFTAVLLNNSVSLLCLRELYTDPVGKPWKRSHWYKNRATGKRASHRSSL